MKTLLQFINIWRGMLEEVLAHIGDGICVLDKDNQIVYANERARSLFAVEDAQFRERIFAAFNSDSPIRFEHFHQDLSRWFEHRTHPGAGGLLTVTSRDITARRRLEEGLRAGEQHLRRLIDANIIGVVVVDDEYVTEANDTFLRMLGYTSEDVARKRLRWRELTPDDYDPRERKARSEYLDNGIFSPYEMEFFRKDGSRASVTLSGIVTQKEPLERLCLVLDMSDTKRAEARVRCIAEASKILESSLEYEKSFMELAEFLVEFGADSSEILIQDEGDVRECWNAGVKREFEFWDGGNSSVPEFKLSLYARVIQTGEPEIQNEPNSSIVVPIIAHGDAAGVIAVYKQRPNAYSKDDFYVFEDLGRRAGFALQHAQLYRHAQRASRLKDEFVAAISHELRTPLTPILGGVYMLRTEGHDDQVFDQALGLIERNAKAQAKIVDDLLDVSRIISGKLRLNVEPVDLASIIRAAAETVQPAGEGKSIRLDLDLRSLNATLWGDADRLQQVFWNLLANAMKFTHAGGIVSVRLLETETHAEVSVTDTGIGIHADFLPYVFDRFRQATTSRTRARGGLGLGLAIVRHLVEAHGGTVGAQSSGDEQGSTFLVRLPLRAMSQAARMG